MRRQRSGCVRFRRGRWELDFRDALGRRHQEACGDLRDPSKRQRLEAEARLHARLGEVNRGVYQAPSEQISVNEMLNRYLASQVAPNVEPETLREYEQMARLYVRPHVGDFVAREVKRAQVEALRAALLKTPARVAKDGPPRCLGPRTVAKALQLLTMAYRYALSHEWVPRDPTMGVKRPSRRSTGASLSGAQVNALTGPELARLFEHASDRWRLLLELAAYTGMREAELCGLSWDDVELETRSIYVRRTWRRGRFKVPKTQHSIRRVEFPKELVAALRERKLRTGHRETNPHNLVFPTEAGNPQNPSNLLHRGLYPALRRAGLRKVTFHGLRHTFATLRLAAGENLGPVSRQLGHANTAVTQSVYRHVLPNDGEGLTDRLMESVRAAGSGGEVVALDPEGPGRAA